MNTSESQVTPERLLQLKKESITLGIEEEVWREALSRAEPDPVVGIRHVEVSGDESYRVHVAAIPKQVGCHVHRVGDEDYAVVEGVGVMHFGKITEGTDGPYVRDQDWCQMPVEKCDSFVVPEGYAHQLRGELTILFGCPDSHLDDTQDRTMLPDAPQV